MHRRCLHAEFKSVLATDTNTTAMPAPLLQAYKQATHELLSKLLQPAATNGAAFVNQPTPLLRSAVRLYGVFGKWVAREEPGRLEGCVHCVLGALQVEHAAEAAAHAFRALCVHAQKQLGKLETVTALMGVCESSLRNEALTAELRVALMEGLARLVASLSREEQAQPALGALLAPPCQGLQRALASLPPDSEPPPKISKESVDSAATNLTLVASAIRFCDRYKPEKHPVLPVLQGAWPLLMEVASRYRGQPVAIQALCDLYSRAMATLGALIRPLLPQLLPHLARSFQSTPVVGCLATLRDAIERFGDENDGELWDLLSQVMTMIIQYTWCVPARARHICTRVRACCRCHCCRMPMAPMLTLLPPPLATWPSFFLIPPLTSLPWYPRLTSQLLPLKCHRP